MQGEMRKACNSSSSAAVLENDYRIPHTKLLEEQNTDYRLLFVTPVSAQDIRISDVVRVKLKLASSEPAAKSVSIAGAFSQGL